MLPCNRIWFFATCVKMANGNWLARIRCLPQKLFEDPQIYKFGMFFNNALCLHEHSIHGVAKYKSVRNNCNE